MKYFLLTIVLGSFLSNADLSAQQSAYFNDGEGKQLYFSRVDYAVEGSPYLYDEYYPADITLTNGSVYKSIPVKINLQNGDIQYKKDNGEEMLALLPVKSVSFGIVTENNKTNAPVKLTSIGTALNENGSVIYQLLDSGKVQLFKRIRVSYKDVGTYGQAGMTRIFEKSEQLFLFGGTISLQKLDKNKKAILELLADKRPAIEKFIDQHKIDCHNEKDIKAVVNYYNSLAGQASSLPNS